MYAIVKTGGKQYKVAEGDVIEVEKLAGAPGDAVTLAAVLLVDGDDLVTDAAKLAKVAVSGEVVAHTKGPKIRIHKFKNKTGYHKRQGHRQPLTQVKVTGISSREVGAADGSQKGCVQLAQRPRLRGPAARREAVRRAGRQRRRDPDPPARHQVPPGRPGRPRRRRHAVRAGRRRGAVRHQARPQDRQHRAASQG